MCFCACVPRLMCAKSSWHVCFEPLALRAKWGKCRPRAHEIQPVYGHSSDCGCVASCVFVLGFPVFLFTQLVFRYMELFSQHIPWCYWMSNVRTSCVNARCRGAPPRWCVEICDSPGAAGCLSWSLLMRSSSSKLQESRTFGVWKMRTVFLSLKHTVSNSGLENLEASHESPWPRICSVSSIDIILIWKLCEGQSVGYRPLRTKEWLNGNT